ncbi:MAG: hypothetical protein AAFR17_11015 [Pseudomonadota bacterium]
MIRSLLCAVVLGLAGIAAAQTEVSPDEVRLTLDLEQLPETLHAGEMVMLTIRGAYRLPITLERLEQPDLPGFDWMQLGEDRWFDTQIDGQTVVNLERRMALFPQEAGPVEIGAFTHHLTLLSPQGRRFEHAARSEGLVLTVSPQPDAEWWFPVRAIEISDAWSNPPEKLSPGQGALRIVTVTAQGAEPELLPPMPALTGAGAHIFPHPERRIVTLGPDGPITRAFWRWTVRPEGAGAAFLDPIEIAYFDTRERAHRQVTLAAQRVAYEGTGRAAPAAMSGPTQQTKAGTTPTGSAPAGDAGATRLSWRIPPGIALLLGLIAGALVLLLRPSLTGRGQAAGALAAGARVWFEHARTGFRTWLTRQRTRRDLTRAVRADDAKSALRAAWRLNRMDAEPDSLDPQIRLALETRLFAQPETPVRSASGAETS